LARPERPDIPVIQKLLLLLNIPRRFPLVSSNGERLFCRPTLKLNAGHQGVIDGHHDGASGDVT
jgi:hypothetical protein